MSMLTLRPACPDDADALWAMMEPVFRAGETYAIAPEISRDTALTYWMGGNHTAYVAEQDGVMLGTAYLCPNHQGNADHICNAGFITAPAARGRGVAQALLTHVMAAARGAGYGAMQFNFVVASNTGAIALWQRNGFDIVGRLPAAFRHPVLGMTDALVMYQLL